MPTHPILIAGNWQPSSGTDTFHATNPATGQPLPDSFPTSPWKDVDLALSAAADAAPLLRRTPPAKLAAFLTRYAERIEAILPALVDAAHAETALPKSPRLQTIELPRTMTQLRQAAAAALESSWALPTIDTKLNIRSILAPIGPVLVIGPNNFPFAYNAIAGGDFASAIATGCPVIAKGHPGHPNTTRLLAEQAFAALTDTGLPPATVQLLYHMSPDSGLRAMADPRLASLGFTGSRHAGLALKAAADAAGKPTYLEMSSLNPVLFLPNALKERAPKIADEFVDSALAANGQFCTSPGIAILLQTPDTEPFIAAVKDRLAARTPSALLSAGVAQSLATNVNALIAAGANLVTGGQAVPGAQGSFANTLLRTTADHFLSHPDVLQTEAFGNASLVIVAANLAEVEQVLLALQGNLTGSIYSATTGEDDDAYSRLAPLLRTRVGRLLNDKMPTGVALSPAMNHGGPYPATGHAGFTAVGMPAALRRFTQLESYDNVRHNRLPDLLQNPNPSRIWRFVNLQWTQDDIQA